MLKWPNWDTKGNKGHPGRRFEPSGLRAKLLLCHKFCAFDIFEAEGNEELAVRAASPLAALAT